MTISARRLELLEQLSLLVGDAPAYMCALYEEGTIEEIEREIAKHQQPPVQQEFKENLYTLIAKVPPNYDWLLRSDAEHGFFAHVCEQSFVRSCGLRGTSSKAYSATPEEALALALQGILR